MSEKKIPAELVDVIFHLEQVADKINAAQAHGSEADGLARAVDIVLQEVADLKEQYGY